VLQRCVPAFPKIVTDSTKFLLGDLIPDLAVSIVLLGLLRLDKQQLPFCREIAQLCGAFFSPRRAKTRDFRNFVDGIMNDV
jgi:hypothetical protein